MVNKPSAFIALFSKVDQPNVLELYTHVVSQILQKVTLEIKKILRTFESEIFKNVGISNLDKIYLDKICMNTFETGKTDTLESMILKTD